MKKSLLLSLLTILMLIGLTTVSFAYWDSLTSRRSEIIEVGEGTTLVVQAQAIAPEGKRLIPSTAVLGVNDVKEVTLTYTVVLSKEAKNDLTLTVNVENVKIGNQTTYANLVNIEINPVITSINNVNVLVSVKVTLNEPANETEYNAIKNQNITFDLVFAAVQ